MIIHARTRSKVQGPKKCVNPMVWRCREFFFSKIFSFFLIFSTRFFFEFHFFGHFSIFRHRTLCPEDCPDLPGSPSRKAWTSPPLPPSPAEPPRRPLGQARVLAPGSEITPWNSHARSADDGKRFVEVNGVNAAARNVSLWKKRDEIEKTRGRLWEGEWLGVEV